MKFAVIMIISFLSSAGYTDSIRCSGTLPFWYKSTRHKDIWQFYDPTAKLFISDSSKLFDEIKFGKNASETEFSVLLFGNVISKKTDKSPDGYDFSTDGKSWITLKKNQRSLTCDISETEFF